VGVSTTIQRRLDWMDTDAADRWHFTTMFRLAEAAEAELHRQLGITDQTFGKTPRVHVEADFRAPVMFDDLLDVTLRVAEVRRKSVTYDVELCRDGDTLATARIVTVFTDGPNGQAAPWPDDVAAALGGAE
jgi:YbgC/YbaW family acyl-CoA thioester hydrolase